MNIFYNAEYTGANQYAQPISMGFVAVMDVPPYTKRLYLEFNDIDDLIVTDTVREQIFPDTYIHDSSDSDVNVESRYMQGQSDSDKLHYTYAVVNRQVAKHVINKWFREALIQSNEKQIQLVSCCCHYDATVLFNLYGGQFPEYLNPVVYDYIFDIFKNWTGSQEALYSKTAQEFKTFLSLDPIRVIYEASEESQKRMPEYTKKHSLWCADLLRIVSELQTTIS